MRKFSILFFLILSSRVSAQLIRTRNLTTFVDSLITAIPDSFGTDKNKYVSSGASDRSTFATVVTNIINTEYATAHTNAGAIGYQLLQYTDNSSSPNKTYYVLIKTEASANYWGSYIFNQSADRQRLVIQSPHPRYDTYTGAQGYYIFKNVGARAFFLAGAHRCNSNTASTCDGTSTVCTGSSAAFRISDQAHTDQGFFLRGTETLSNLITNLLVIQVHGFSKQVDDPDVIISNGTKLNPSSTDYVDAIKTNLLTEDNTLTFKIPHIDTSWDRLNGTTNLQGRFVNGSGDPCTTAPSSANGRFVHIEQKKDGLRNPSSDWSKLSNAIANSVALDALPAELSSFSAECRTNSVELKWTTVTELNNYGFEIEQSAVSNSSHLTLVEAGKSLAKSLLLNAHSWKKIAFVNGHGNSNSLKNYSFTDLSPIFGKVQYRLKQIDFDGKFKFSKIVEIQVPKPSNFLLKQNYPNPFNPETTIEYSIPVVDANFASTNRHVTLKVYDLLGREVATLVDDYKQAGSYNYQFSIRNSKLVSGVYFYRLQSSTYSETKKLIIMK
jgi:hypothetical protein